MLLPPMIPYSLWSNKRHDRVPIFSCVGAVVRKWLGRAFRIQWRQAWEIISSPALRVAIAGSSTTADRCFPKYFSFNSCLSFNLGVVIAQSAK